MLGSLSERCSEPALRSLIREYVQQGVPGSSFDVSMIPDGIPDTVIEFRASEFGLKPNTTYNSRVVDNYGKVEFLRGLPILIEPDSSSKQSLDAWIERLPGDHKFIEKLPKAYFRGVSDQRAARVMANVLLHWQNSKEAALVPGFKMIALSFLLHTGLSISKHSTNNLQRAEDYNLAPLRSRLATLAVKGMASDRFEAMSVDVQERLHQSLESGQLDTALCLLILLVIVIAGLQTAVLWNHSMDENKSEADKLHEELEELENKATDLIIQFYRRCEASKLNWTLVKNLKSEYCEFSLSPLL